MIANESYTLEELNVSYYCTWGIRHCYISLISPIDGKLQPMKLDIKKKKRYPSVSSATWPAGRLLPSLGKDGKIIKLNVELVVDLPL